MERHSQAGKLLYINAVEKGTSQRVSSRGTKQKPEERKGMLPNEGNKLTHFGVIQSNKKKNVPVQSAKQKF